MYRMFTLTTRGDVEVLGGVRVDYVRHYKSVLGFCPSDLAVRDPSLSQGCVRLFCFYKHKKTEERSED